MGNPLILVVNLGATSSKLALYTGSQPLKESSFPLSDSLAKAPLTEQRPERVKHLAQFLADAGVEPAAITAVAARGGLTKPLSRRGVYRVDRELLADLEQARYGSHPSSLSPLAAHDWAVAHGLELPLYIVDAVNTDTIWDEARLSGVPGVERFGRHHALNVHRAARQAAERLGKPLHLCHLVVGHFGSGTSICSVAGGRTVDVNDAQLGEGPFSVARAGTLPLRGVLDLAYAEPERKKLEQRLSRDAGLVAYTGTADFREIEKRLMEGDPAVRRAYQAFVFQNAKYLAAAAGALGIKPDAVVLTGGLIKSERFTRELRARIEWLAPVIEIPGEDEMAALAEGVFGVLNGRAVAQVYATAQTPDQAPPDSYKEVLDRAGGMEGYKFVVAGGNHPEVAETVRLCREHGIRGFVLVGPWAEIEAQLKAEGLDPAGVEIVDSQSVEQDAIDLVLADPCAALVKGQCNTAALLKAVLKCLPEDSTAFLSHVAVVEDAQGGRLVGITDGGLNLDPDLRKKAGMMENAIAMFHALGVAKPNVLLAAGMEDKGQDIPAIADARELVKRHRAGEWPTAVIDGPFGVDVGFISEAAVLKGISTPLAGLADIVVAPNLESCNFAVKLMTYATGAPWGGLVVGGPFPVVLGSRTDDALSRVCSIALAQLVVAGSKQA